MEGVGVEILVTFSKQRPYTFTLSPLLFHLVWQQTDLLTVIHLQLKIVSGQSRTETME